MLIWVYIYIHTVSVHCLIRCDKTKSYGRKELEGDTKEGAQGWVWRHRVTGKGSSHAAACTLGAGPARTLESPGQADTVLERLTPNEVKLTYGYTSLGRDRPWWKQPGPGRPAGQPSAGARLSRAGALTHLYLSHSKGMGLAQAHPPKNPKGQQSECILLCEEPG